MAGREARAPGWPSRRGARRRVLALLTVAVAPGLAGVAASCSRSDGGAAAVQATQPAALSEVAVDACGNDLSALTSTVWAIDPASGEVRWTTSVPLVDAYLLESAAGNPQVPLQRRSVEVELDRATGAVVAYPPAGAHEVLVDVPSGALLVDGTTQPERPAVDGLNLDTGSEVSADGHRLLVATDAAGAAGWQVDLGVAPEVAAVSRPVLYGDTAVVTTSPIQPSCGPKG